MFLGDKQKMQYQSTQFQLQTASWSGQSLASEFLMEMTFSLFTRPTVFFKIAAENLPRFRPQLGFVDVAACLRLQNFPMSL